MKIQNNTFLISGGASGLGFATAKMIIANGGRISLPVFGMAMPYGAATAAIQEIIIGGSIGLILSYLSLKPHRQIFEHNKLS